MVHGVSIITPPEVTNQVIEEIIELGIEHVWMQPGAESPWAIARAKEAGINCIAGGACLLVVLGYKDNWTTRLRTPVFDNFPLCQFFDQCRPRSNNLSTR